MPEERGAQATHTENKQEAKKVEERVALPARLVHETIRREGAEELERPSSALFWSALAAGLAMGFSFVGEGLLRSALPDAPWRPLVSSLGYTLGFLLVVLGRQQLFTENTLTPLLPILDDREPNGFGKLFRLWGIVLGGNLLGALLFATAVVHLPVFEPRVHETLLQIGRDALAAPFWPQLVRGVFAGWLIAMMVWLLPAAESAHVAVIGIITYVVGLAHLTHVIAGSVETLALVVNGETSPWHYLGGFLAPALIGNTIGGVALVAALNHAQVKSGENS